MVSLLKTWYGPAATKDNEYAFNFLPQARHELVVDVDLRPGPQRERWKGVMLSGMTATSIGPDVNQVMQALSNLKWLV
jgi:formate dehydrogenase major subunit